VIVVVISETNETVTVEDTFSFFDLDPILGFIIILAISVCTVGVVTVIGKLLFSVFDYCVSPQPPNAA